VFDFLKNYSSIAYVNDVAVSQFSPIGSGWAWNDYQEDYMPERSEFPIYGNVAKFYLQDDTLNVVPSYFFNSSLQLGNSTLKSGAGTTSKIIRPFENNDFYGVATRRPQSRFSPQYVPFKTRELNNPNVGQQLFIKLLEDTLRKTFSSIDINNQRPTFKNVIHSQPTDSLLKIMMYRSDNFFAEQTLLMVSNELLGVMSDRQVIDTLLKTDFKDLPQKPRWVDGSGLSRYDLITPQDEVKVLEKIKDNFSWNRITTIFITGDEGTLRTHYKKYVGKIYAKTGSLSDVIALSGFITTHKNHSYIFSVMINQHQADATEVRDKIEKFISTIIEEY
jgi:D-alanyl-D-alanine carboxypeptidase/D-alanyl-D-alanine-endopeptidase (penicillin-binding protein 4)